MLDSVLTGNELKLMTLPYRSSKEDILNPRLAHIA